MLMHRPVELVSGLAAGVFGLLALGYNFLFLFSSEEEYDRTLVTFLAVVVSSIVGIATGAYLHGWRDIEVGWKALWLSTALLMLCVLVGFFSVGLLLLPAALLALVASVAAGA